MRSIAITHPLQHRNGVNLTTTARGLSMAPMAIAGAWLVAVAAQVTGNAAMLHHHALIEGDSPLWVALPVFLVGWQVMIAAMMLPASLPAIGDFNAGVSRLAQPRRARTAFLGSYTLVWTIFGLLAFLGDVVLHRVVDATPWLAARPWLIEASVLGLAGAYQLTPHKRRSLEACRHPALQPPSTSQPQRGPFQLGLDHGLACLAASWALMLLIFAEGFASLGWMIALTAAMAYETTGRHGLRGAAALGVLLLQFSAVILLVGWRTTLV